MCAQYLCHIHPSTPFPHLFPQSHWYQLPR
jgi:hypothetical protein